MLWRRKFTNTAVVYFLLVVVVLVGSYRALRSPSPASPITQDGPDFWEWDTNTRFNNDNAVRNGKKHSLCDAFPADVLSQIQVVLKVGSSEPSDRIDTQISTVTRCIPNILIVSDQDSELHGHHVHDVLESLPESFRNNTPEFEAHDAIAQGQPPDAVDDRLGWNLDRFKFLPMVEKAYRVSPSAKWFVFLESDTYFVWDNLFRLLDKFDPWTPWYMGSPSPGRHTKDDEVTWFAYGGAGFVLSIGALEKLFAQSFWSSKASLSEQYEELVKTDNCGDSVLGWVLHEKGVKLTGLWPMFNAHALNGVPFGPHWCQPVISLHKTLLPDMEGLVKWENQRGWKEPLLYADLFDYLKMGTFDHKHDWDNADWGGWQEPPESPAHASFKACGKACHENPQCFSYTYNSSGHCFFIPTVRLGSKRSAANPKDKSTAGWDVRKIQGWQKENQCKNPQWMKPSITRIF